MIETLFGSRVRAKILEWLFSHPDERFYVRRLTALLQEDSTNVSRELVRLEKTGILESSREGNHKYYQVNRKNPVFKELHGLIVKTTGVADVIRKSFEPLNPQIAAAFIFGSIAEGTESAASDIDLMIIGEVSFGDTVSALTDAESKLGREINPVVYSVDEFRTKTREAQNFIQTVLRNKKIFVAGSEDELARLAS